MHKKSFYVHFKNIAVPSVIHRALANKSVNTLYTEMCTFVYPAGVTVIDKFFFEKMIQLVYQ